MEIWLKTTLLAGLIVSSATAARMLGVGASVTDWMFWLIWPAMVLHQCEENVFTELMLGRAWSFTTWVKTVGYHISPRRALALNVLVGWTMAVAGGVAGEHAPLVPLFVAVVEAVNGFWHLSVTSLTRRWSPGTLSSVTITIPLAFFLVHTCLLKYMVSASAACVLFLLACCSHHVFLCLLPRVRT